MKSKNSNIKFQLLILLCISAVLVSCRPRGILSSNEMRKLLVDLHQTDAMMQVAGLKYTDQEQKEIYYAQVMERHGVTQAEFDSSLVWYTAHPQLFDKIYPKVMADLGTKEKEIDLLLEEETEQSATQQIAPFFHEQLDTTIWELQFGSYPTLRADQLVVRDSLMHDSIDQLLPEVSVLSGGVVDSL